MASTELATASSPAQEFRIKAADLLIEAANMTLHQLVDEFQRLSGVMEGNVIDGSDEIGRAKLNADGELALRQRNLVNGAARARFGISFETWDRNLPHDGNGY